jgi:hypothetical protein
MCLVLILTLLVLSACSRGGASDGGVAKIDTSQGIGIAANADNRSDTQAEGTMSIPAGEKKLDGTTGIERTDEEIVTEFAQCMRQQGFNSPDPELNADGTVDFGAMREAITQDPNFDPTKRKFRETFEACGPILREATFTEQRAGEDPIALEDNLLAYAQCLRDQGFDVPDPDFSAGGRQAMRPLVTALIGQASQGKITAAVNLCRETIFGGDARPMPRGGSGGPTSGGSGGGHPR